MQEEEWIVSEKERRSNFRFYSIIVLLFLAFMGLSVYRNKTYGIVLVSGTSMNQTLQNGEELVMKKQGFSLERGDVIIVNLEKYEEEFNITNTKNIIKRLIAVEGDKIKCVDGQVYIWKAEGRTYEALSEPYAYYSKDKTEYDFAEYELKEGEIFFLGDNRFNSLDSRYKEGQSHLDRLYKQEDVIGVVPDWAMRNEKWVEFAFFGVKSCAKR